MDQPYLGPRFGPGIAAAGRIDDARVRDAMEFAHMIVDTVREGLLVLDLDLRVQAANESAYRTFGCTREETESLLLYEIWGGIWDHPRLRGHLERVLPEHHAFGGVEIEQERTGDDRRVFRLSARQLDDHQRILLSIENVTERVRAEGALDRAYRELEQINGELDQRVQARTGQVRMLASQLAVAEQEERRRLALVLHDDLQQHLFGAGMALSLVNDAESVEERSRLVGHVQRLLSDAANLTRTLATELSPDVQSDRIRDVLRWLAGRTQTTLGLHVEVSGDAVVTSPPVRMLLYHLVREALFNVSKHARTEQARVTIAESGEAVVVRIEDDGAGFDASSADGSGFGLSSIRNRLEVVGGRLDVASAPGEGTRLTMRLPRDLGLSI